MDQKDEGTQDDRGRDGETNFILRIKEKETRLTLQEHDDDDDDTTITVNCHYIHTHTHSTIVARKCLEKPTKGQGQKVECQMNDPK